MAALSLERIDKRFGAVHAVDDVSLEFAAGRVHAVIGENGAGKSTLLKIAAGILEPDAGAVRIDGSDLRPHTAREAIRRGVGMVQQHFALVAALSALENVMLGAEPLRSAGRLDFDSARARADEVAREMEVSLPWDAPVSTLGVGDRQRLEVVRILVREARVVILDEPTAVLTPNETVALYAALRRIANTGRAVVVVTHRLDEVRDHADYVSVLRRGRLVASRAMTDRGDKATAAIARDVMGEDVAPAVRPRARDQGAIRLDVLDVRRGPGLQGATLSVRGGEVVGVAGVEGNGQRELVRLIAGLDAPEGGSVMCGPVAVVHEDRETDGLVLDASVRDNLVLGELRRFTRFGIVNAAALDREARSRLDRMRVDVVAHPLGARAGPSTDLDVPVRFLSGGNRQKVVVARAVSRSDRASVLVFAQPTRGVDVGTARAIHTEIVGAAEAGKAVLVVSADLAELRALCDRILVMTRGRIVADLPPDAPEATIGEAMLSAPSKGTAA